MSRLCQFLWWLVLSGCTPAVAPALAPAVAPAVPSESPLHLRRCALGEHGYWAAVVRHTDRGHLLSLYLAAVPDQARDQDLLCELDWNAVLRVQPSRLQLVREPSCWVTGRIYGTALAAVLPALVAAWTDAQKRKRMEANALVQRDIDELRRQLDGGTGGVPPNTVTVPPRPPS